jgi:hypothetical protein
MEVYPEGSVAADELVPVPARILLALPSTFLLVTFFLPLLHLNFRMAIISSCGIKMFCWIQPFTPAGRAAPQRVLARFLDSSIRDLSSIRELFWQVSDEIVLSRAWLVTEQL